MKKTYISPAIILLSTDTRTPLLGDSRGVAGPGDQLSKRNQFYYEEDNRDDWEEWEKWEEKNNPYKIRWNPWED